MRACVIGSPVSHSLSPAIFTYISLDQGKSISYEAREVKPGTERDFLCEAKNTESFAGANVTIPLKELLIKEVDSVSDAVKAIGAMNVLHLKSGKAEGHNTDVIGIEKTLLRSGIQLENRSVLLWGAGGSAKAVAFVLGKLKVKTVFVFNRGPRGKELTDHFSSLFPDTKFITISSLTEIRSVPLALMINTTPLGMQGQDSGTAYFEEARNLSFEKEALAFDLIYVPEETDFLRLSKSLGLKTVGGLGMLIDQALATWEIWVGPLSDWDKLHEKLQKFLRGMLKLRHVSDPIYLTGFMGAGKTTVGKRLSELSKREFVDTDVYIEHKTQMTIPEIFSRFGEADFRKREVEAITELSLKKNVIISLGGGALKSAENIDTTTTTGTLVHLKARPETLYERVEKDATVRPLLRDLEGREKLQKISSLLKEREVLYSVAHFSIDTSELNPTQVSLELISRLGRDR